MDLLVSRTRPGYRSFSRSLSFSDSSLASTGGDPTESSADALADGGDIERGIDCVGGEPYRPGMLTGNNGGLIGV